MTRVMKLGGDRHPEPLFGFLVAIPLAMASWLALAAGVRVLVL